MTERHPRGFLEAGRQAIGHRDPAARRLDYQEIYAPHWNEGPVATQAGRCMDCGVPTCMGGCPIANLIPEWNDLVSRRRWREALARLHATNNFPEFTGYTCPAPCEPACVLSINDQPVTIKSIERAIVDMGWSRGWIVPEPPRRRSGFGVGVVGSGPAGLACAQQLNRAGHRVTVYERDDAIGGLMTYGIPDFKFAKWRVAQRVRQLSAEGVSFRTGIEVGRDIDLDELRDTHDAVCLAIGALRARELAVPGRDLPGVELALDYLIQENRRQAGRDIPGRQIRADGRRVVVLGGGDTGADCVATAHRQGAASVTQVDINLPRPGARPPDNPWPQAPIPRAPSYAQEEGGVEEYGFEALAFSASPHGRVAAVCGRRVSWTYSAGRRRLARTVVAPDVVIGADLVLIAAGFSGPQTDPFGGLLPLTDSGTLAVDARMRTPLERVFAAGDARMGQSIVVWAIGEGRDAARAIDLQLRGHSSLEPGVRTANPPTDWQI